MSLGRSSDGRIFTRDGRLCIGCCGASGPCPPFAECRSLALPFLACPLDFGSALNNFSVAIETTELSYSRDYLLPVYNGSFADLVETYRVSICDQTAWSTTLTDGGLSLGTPYGCTPNTPDCSLIANLFRQGIDGEPEPGYSGQDHIVTYGGGWDQLNPNQLATDTSGDLRFGPQATPLTLENLLSLMLTAGRSPTGVPICQFDSDNEQFPPGFTVDPFNFIRDRRADLHNALRNVPGRCGISGGREFVGYTFNSALDLYDPRYTLTGPEPDAISTDRPSAVFQDEVNLIGFPPDEYAVTHRIEITETPTGFVLEVEWDINVRVHFLDFNTSGNPYWALDFSEVESGRLAVAYTVQGIGDCPPPGVSGFFA